MTRAMAVVSSGSMSGLTAWKPTPARSTSGRYNGLVATTTSWPRVTQPHGKAERGIQVAGDPHVAMTMRMSRGCRCEQNDRVTRAVSDVTDGAMAPSADTSAQAAVMTGLITSAMRSYAGGR